MRELQEHLEQLINEPIVSTSRVSGGCISDAAVITTSSNFKYFLKSNSNAPRGFFAAEAVGLAELAKPGAIRIPEVIFHYDNPSGNIPAFIVLEYLEPGGGSVDAQRELGESLAVLHKTTAKEFGFGSDNFIGSLEQRNNPRETWAEFFVKQRLEVQLELGAKNGWLNINLESLFAEKRPYIEKTLAAIEEPPTLLHGDLWSGNVFWSDTGPALIDPAVYYGSREADIAFSELFGGFGSAFYSAYNNTFPLAPGYEERKQVLNLYHLMTHSNLFGGSYITQLYSALKTLPS